MYFSTAERCEMHRGEFRGKRTILSFGCIFQFWVGVGVRGGPIFIFLFKVRDVLTSWRVSSETDNFKFWVQFRVLGGSGCLDGLCFYIF